jgi:hypothetical protein
MTLRNICALLLPAIIFYVLYLSFNTTAREHVVCDIVLPVVLKFVNLPLAPTVFPSPLPVH